MQKASTSKTEGLRLFVGTALQSATADAVARAAAGQLLLPHWKAAPRAQWHVTTLFIGQRPEAELPALLSALEQVARTHAAFHLHDGRLVAMPEAEPAMLWLRFTPSPALETLHQALAGAMHAASSPHQPHWPHITLARGRAGSPLPDGRVVLYLLRIARLTLFRSDAVPGGRVHVPVGEVHLGPR